MKTDLTPEQIKNGREFLKDLRANPKKAIGLMRDSKGGRCCLCVAYETALRLGAQLPKDNDVLPPPEICDVYGWDNVNPILGDTIAGAHNDGSDLKPERSHAEIADLFEEEFPQLKP